ncbi:MAG: PQQ-binding-like beta-propeller repeat protein [Alphaproteobacteria bacterium]|nr:PQQ-binding-like beta-propeller repeat protein [Alphaproteobacteria bacterium]
MKYSVLCLLCSILFVSGCVNEEKVAPTEGRIAVSTHLNPTLKEVKNIRSITLSSPTNLFTWGQSGVTGQNAIPHTLGENTLKLIWDTNIGKGLNNNRLSIAQPVVDKGIIYTLDADFNLSAINLKNGKKLWHKKLPLENSTTVKTVGLAYSYSTLFAVSGNGTILCISLNGNILWQKNLNTALRSMPVIYKNIMYLLTANNHLMAFDTTTGKDVWDYKGLPTQTNLLGMGTPALYKEYAVIPFSNGEIITFNTLDESVVWSEYLSSDRSFNRISDLTHILASPVIENGIVYLIGNAGKMGAYRLENGENIWTLPMGGANTPVISGNALFMINNQNVLLALNKHTGKVFWNTALTSHDTEEHAFWKGPLLVGDNAILTSSNGDIIFIDIKSGQERNRLEVDGIAVAPINVDGTVLFLTEDADLLAYK